MGSKQRRKASRPAAIAEERAKPIPWLFIVSAVAIATVGGFLLVTSTSQQAPSETGLAGGLAAETTATGSPPVTSPTTPATYGNLDDLPMPPLPYMNQTAGPPELMRQAYVFAARNPDILDYVPCYCGCGQTDGHVGNTDCFVESRAPNGQVLEWAPHGMT
ncbi:MAG: PCYCGC motif-containing (lipo)protein [Acidobacteriota bacterium]|nr:PCYCGC motif-containing (lipo)protein [Acidobacteriota bacterium]